MSSENEILELQEKIVIELAQFAPIEWSLIALNSEITEGSSGSPVCNRICYWINKSGDKLVSDNISITLEIADMLIALRNLFSEKQEQKWDICDLTIGSNGKYDFSYSYDGIKQLAGIFDYESMFRFDGQENDYETRIKRIT